MDDRSSLFAMALGLNRPWFVSEIKLDTAKGRLDLDIDFEKGTKFPCPKCGKMCALHDTTFKEWRHLDFFQYQAYLHARVPRATCLEHGVLQVDVPWARPGSGFTLYIEAMIMALSSEMTVLAISEHLRLSDDAVWRVLMHHVNLAKEKQDLSHITDIAFDEFAVGKGHEYVTLVYDLNGKRVVYIAEGKDKGAVDEFIEATKGRFDPTLVKRVSMDMSRAYIAAAKKHFPRAEVVFDHFHVIKKANESLDKVRKREAKVNMELLAKTKYVLLKNPINLTKSQEKRRQELLAMKEMDLDTVRSYHIKLGLQRVWQVPGFLTRHYLRKWIQWATRSAIPEMVDLGRCVKDHYAGILAGIRSGITNALAEGLNNKIRMAFHRAFGFKAPAYRDTMIFLVAGDLPISREMPFTHSK